MIPDGEAGLPVETDQTVLADGSRLEELLENLFVRIVEHGEEDVTRQAGTSRTGTTSDKIVGILNGERDDTFEAEYSTGVDGTGFGQRTVKQIVDAHGWGYRRSTATAGEHCSKSTSDWSIDQQIPCARYAHPRSGRFSPGISETNSRTRVS